jgi:hypothetical protein
MSSFDDKFSDKVREVFDSYHEEVDPVAFANMRQGLVSGNGLRSSVGYWVLAAASVILLLGAMYMWNQYGLSAYPDQLPPSTDNMIAAVPQIDSNGSSLDSISGKSEDITADSFPEQADFDSQSRSTGSTLMGASTSNGNSASSTSTSQLKEAVELPSAIAAADTQVESTETTTRENAGIEGPFRSQVQQVSALDANTTDGFIAQMANDIDSSQQSVLSYSERVLTPLRQAERNVELVLGSMVNYTNSQIAQGVGFVAGALRYWKLNEVVSVATGGLISVNQFEYTAKDPGMPQPSAGGGDPGAWLTGGSLDVNVGENYDFRYTAIDIPINTRVQLGNTGNSSYTMTLGVSSLVYLSQTIRERGTNYNGFSTLNEATGDVELTFRQADYDETDRINAFDRVDLGRILNVSFGFTPDRRKNQLELELYMKYPLGNVTSKDIALGMGGLTLKYRL